jgi:YD repeat-containing protein
MRFIVQCVVAILIPSVAWAQTVPVISTALQQPQGNVTVKTSVKSAYASPNTNHDPIVVSKVGTSSKTSVKSTSTPSALSVSASSSGGSTQIPTLNSVSLQVEPFTGSANVPVPIAVPQGRAGIQPSIALVYNSNASDGFLGVGWTLDFGSIQRSTKKGIPKYDASDTFVMTTNGSTQELVFDSLKNVYHPQIEGSFEKIERVNDYWCVTDKKGTKYYFGQTVNARVLHPDSPSMIDRWALNRVEDLNGNYMTVTYLTPENNNNLYPSTVEYTGNSKLNLAPFVKVVFDYTTAPRVLRNRRPGFEMRTTYSLSTIAVKVNGIQQSLYRLSYTNSTVTSRPLLTSVTQYAGDGVTALPSVRFTYQADKGFMFDTASWSYPAGMDFVWINTSARYMDMGTRVIDVDGDGYADLLKNFRDCDFGKDIQTFLNNKNKGFTSTALWQLPADNYLNFARQCTNTAYDYGVRFVDVDGDGWQDIVWHSLLGNGTTNIKTYLNNHAGQFVESSQWAMPYGTYITWDVSGFMMFSGIIFADVNGDGYTDVVWSKRGGGNGGQTTYLNNAANGGTGWTASAVWDVPVNQYTDFSDGATLVDLNGDGLPEIVYAVDNTIVVHYNTGAGWRQAGDLTTPWDVPPIAANLRTGLSQFADINGDGLADLVTADVNASSNQQLKVAINTGSGWLYDPAWNFWSGSFATYDTRLADLNADGMTDFVYSLMGGYDVVINKGKPSDLLIKIDNGIGGSTEVAYDSSAHFQNTFLPFPVQVVASMTVKESLMGSSYTTQYIYGQGLWDQVDREFRGFGSVKTVDPAGNYSVGLYHQDKYLKGRLKEQSIYDAAGKLFTKVTNTWQQSTVIAGSQFVFLKRTDTFDYDGNPTGRRTAQEFFYNEPVQYGNLTKTVQYGEVDLTTGADISNDKRTTEMTYLNNPSVWLLGLPNQITIRNNGGTQVRQSTMYYDNHPGLNDVPIQGLLTKSISWAGSTATAHPTTLYAYNAVGLLSTTTDPKGNVTSIQYDPQFLFPLVIINALIQNGTNEN